MKPAPFTYHRAESAEEAAELLGGFGGEARVLAGGQSLVPMMALRLSQPAHLIDANPASGLAGISRSDGMVTIGAMTRQRSAEGSDVVARDVALLAQALPHIAHPQIRNRGTIGGSVAHADPAAEIPAVFAVLDATMVARSARGQRRIQAPDFFLGYLTTALEPDELLEAIEVPVTDAGTGWSEVCRRHGDFALAGAGALVRCTDGIVDKARVGFISVGPAPVVIDLPIEGERPTADVLEQAARDAAAQLEPSGDVHATGAYRKHVAAVVARRALEQAANRGT